MIKNYLLTAFRNILRHKGFSFINILGLALSMSVCMLIIVIIIDQFKYDDFVKNRDRLYRIESIDNNSSYSLKNYASTTYPLYKELTTKYALVENAAVINNRFSGKALHNKKRLDINGFYVNESFISLFNFSLSKSTSTNQLKEPFTILLMDDYAKKYFGDEDPLGKFISVDSLGEFKVTGIINTPANKSQFQFDALVSNSTLEVLEKTEKISPIVDNWEQYWSSYIYILVNENTNLNNIQAALDEISKEQYSNIEEEDVSFYLKPFNKIVPGAFIGNEIGMFLPKIFIYFFAGLALVIIISAAFNYTSLSMARSLMRAKEVGVRKTLGAARKQIIFQFLAEAILTALFALFFAILILQVILPGFSGMKMMALLDINPTQDFAVYLWFFGFALLTGFVSGILPSVYISAFNPIKVLKGVSNVKLLSKITLRKILLVTQFVFSMVFIVSIILIYNQMNYMVNAKMGFDRDVVYNIRLGDHDFNTIKDYYSQIPEISKISGASHVPGVGRISNTSVRVNPEDEKMEIHSFNVDENYIETMGLELVAGSNFPRNTSSETEKFAVVDENAIKTFNLGNPSDAVGKNIIINDSTLVEITGVIQDYQYAALFLPKRPLVLRFNTNNFEIAALRIEAGVTPTIINKIEKQWEEIDDVNELNGEFLDSEIKDYYSYFEDIIYTVGFTSVLAIVIACLGLLGMATYSTQTRIKEIGIRKVYGAENKTIIYLISKTYLILFLIAAAIASPLSYIINTAWLQYIANHPPFGFGTIFTGIILIIGFGMLTIASQTFKAARTNPAESLRYE